MFSCEYCEISKNTYFEEHLRTAASEVTLGIDYLGISFWTDSFKTILTFKPELQSQVEVYALFKFNP